MNEFKDLATKAYWQEKDQAYIIDEDNINTFRFDEEAYLSSRSMLADRFGLDNQAFLKKTSLWDYIFDTKVTNNRLMLTRKSTCRDIEPRANTNIVYEFK